MDSQIVPQEAERNFENATQAWIVTPVNEDELRLMFSVDDNDIAKNDAHFAFGVVDCDGCGSALETYGLFIDGRLRGQLEWANLCAKCFIHKGEGVAWGKGQLYAKQPNGDWRMVAGFPPEESE